MGQLETRADFAVRRDGRTGRGLVHRTILCALLFADGIEGKRAFGAIHHRDRAPVGDAALCVHGSALRSHRTQVDHDAWLFTRGGFLLAHLSRDATRRRIERRHRNVPGESRYRRHQPHPQTEVNGKLEAAKEVLPYVDLSTLIGSPVAWKLILLVFIQVFFVTMVYGPIAAYLVEAFPAKIRYTSLSLPYHIGNGVFGGLLPVIGLTVVERTGNIYAGLYYPIIVASLTFIIGSLLLKETKHTLIWDEIR